MKLQTLAVACVIAVVAGVGAASAESRSQSMKMGPPHLIVRGAYSDVRFIDMTVPHHLMAIEMAKVEVRRGEHQEMKDMARQMIAAQTAEIAQLKSIRKRLTGSAAAATMMNPHVMAETGMPTPAQIGRSEPTDLAFIDAMVPHHSSMNPMANVALRRSRNATLRRMARNMIDAQSKEIGQMIMDRQAWYPDAVTPPRP